MIARPMLSYMVEKVNRGIVIFHPEGEIRITECPKCGGSLAGVVKWVGARPSGSVRTKLLCPSCRKDISWELSKILLDLMWTMTHPDGKADYAEAV